MTEPARIVEIDPFDLPEWLGTEGVTWLGDSGIQGGHAVRGRLSTADDEPVPCDLLAVDEAYPRPVVPEDVRFRAHQEWSMRQVLLVEIDGRMTLAVPGVEFDADRVLDALGRLAKAVGASPDRYAALVRIGTDRG